MGVFLGATFLYAHKHSAGIVNAAALLLSRPRRNFVGITFLGSGKINDLILLRVAREKRAKQGKLSKMSHIAYILTDLLTV